MMKSLEDIRAAFRNKRAPLTLQRLAVYEELAGRRDHPSAESLYGSLKARYPSLSLATVYKTLQTLHGMGLVARVDSPNNQARFDADVKTHHHAICGGCGRIVDVYDPRLDALALPETPGFEVAGFSVHLSGLCSACAKKKTRSGR